MNMRTWFLDVKREEKDGSVIYSNPQVIKGISLRIDRKIVAEFRNKEDAINGLLKWTEYV